jgi:hypothetical protein|tara:strand:- start:444 stop:1487 length:1044 start_codon:yes stop_codon:yes gene_type:complete
MQQYAKIKKGVYGKKHYTNIVLPLVAGVAKAKNGQLYVTVYGGGDLLDGTADRNRRFKIDNIADVEIVSEKAYEDANKKVQLDAKPEVDDATRTAQISERFEILDEMTSACKSGTVRAMIVSGPAGVGKSYGITTQLQKASMFDNLQGELKWEIVKGATSAIGLYKKLFRYADAGNVLVFDDCDAVLYDDLSLNILKAALDSGKKRIIQWNTESRVLQNEGIPDKFEFKGSVIFVTNIKFDFVKSKKLQDHLGALMSRCHYIDLALDTVRDKMLRIKQVLGNGMLDGYKLPVDKEVAKQDILAYLEENVGNLRELSLRTALKLADLRVLNGERWKVLADTTILRRGI